MYVSRGRAIEVPVYPRAHERVVRFFDFSVLRASCRQMAVFLLLLFLVQQPLNGSPRPELHVGKWKLSTTDLHSSIVNLHKHC